MRASDLIDTEAGTLSREAFSIVFPEEAMLERVFGPAYVEYKAAVRRWL